MAIQKTKRPLIVLIFGLGNPGEKFIGTRHNLGRDILDLLREKWFFSEWQRKERLRAEISSGEVASRKIILAKSLTFMNESGKTVKSLAKNCLPAEASVQAGKLKIENLIVFHDDIDLPIGEIKISRGRSSAGHKGVKSIIRELGTKNFVRFRMGIKVKTLPPTTSARGRMVGGQKSKISIENEKLERFVLERFSDSEKVFLKEAVKSAIEAIELALKDGLEKAMQKFNR